MFDFEKLEVYNRSIDLNRLIWAEVLTILKDKNLHSQLRRASMSIILNIAEGSGRFTNADKRNFYIIARSSLFECVSIFQIIRSQNNLNDKTYSKLYLRSEEVSKMLFNMIRLLSK